MPTPKKPGSMLRIEAYLATIAENLAYPAEGIKRDAFLALHDAIEACGDEDIITAMITDYFTEHSHLTKSKVLVPKAMRDAAFGANPKLVVQGDIVKKYGKEAAEAVAEKYAGRLGSLQPGADPDDRAKALTLESAKKVVKEADAVAKKTESTNPYSPHFKGDKLAAIEGILKRMGTKHCQQLSAAHHVDIAGRPLRTSAR